MCTLPHEISFSFKKNMADLLCPNTSKQKFILVTLRPDFNSVPILLALYGTNRYMKIARKIISMLAS